MHATLTYGSRHRVLAALFSIAFLAAGCEQSGGGLGSSRITGPTSLLPSDQSLVFSPNDRADTLEGAVLTGPVSLEAEPKALSLAWRPLDTIASPQVDASAETPTPLEAIAGAKPLDSAPNGSPVHVGQPVLSQPTVNHERKTAAIFWRPGPGQDPDGWRLEFILPSGGFGSLDFPPDQTALLGTLPMPGRYEIRVCAISYDGPNVCSESRVFELNPPATGPPGPPRNVSGSARGSTLILTWDAPDPTVGGPPITYVVLHNGVPYVVGLAPGVTVDVPPGRYLLAVLARNLAGDSPAVTVEVTVGNPTAAGTYSGPFSGRGAFTRTGTSCTWDVSFTGTVTIVLTDGSDGLTGTIRVSGTWTTPSPGPQCNPGSGSYNSTNPVAISGTQIARSQIPMDLATGTFTGNLVGNTIAGSLNAVYNNGPGTANMSVTLR